MSALCKCRLPVHEPSPEMQKRREALAAKHGRAVRPVALCPVCILRAIMGLVSIPTRAMKRQWRRRCYRARLSTHAARALLTPEPRSPAADGEIVVYDSDGFVERIIVAPWLR